MGARRGAHQQPAACRPCSKANSSSSTAKSLVPSTPPDALRTCSASNPGARPALVSRDLNYLRGIAAQCGNRLDALHREREAVIALQMFKRYVTPVA